MISETKCNRKKLGREPVGQELGSRSRLIEIIVYIITYTYRIVDFNLEIKSVQNTSTTIHPDPVWS